jgi:hypothetical protein
MLRDTPMNGERFAFDSLWHNFDDLDLPEAPDNMCQYARALSDSASKVRELGLSSDIVAVNQAKLLLLEKYFEFFCIVPRQHRYHLSPRGHKCIFQVFIELYSLIKSHELSSLSPPMLFEPPPPPPPPQIAGIFLGEEIEEEEE